MRHVVFETCRTVGGNGVKPGAENVADVAAPLPTGLADRLAMRDLSILFILLTGCFFQDARSADPVAPEIAVDGDEVADEEAEIAAENDDEEDFCDEVQDDEDSACTDEEKEEQE